MYNSLTGKKSIEENKDYCGGNVFTLTQPAEAKDLKYSEKDFEITFKVQHNSFSSRLLSGGNDTDYDLGFELLNKTNNIIEIIWDQSLYINREGNSNKIVPGGVKFISADQAIVPTVIAPNSKSQNSFIPKPMIFFQNGEWHILHYDYGDYVGSIVGLLLRLKINNEVVNKSFKFKICAHK